MPDEKIRDLERRWRETGAEGDLSNLERALRKLGQIRNLTQTYTSLAMACDPILIHPEDRTCFSVVVASLRNMGMQPQISTGFVRTRGVLYAATSGNRGEYTLIDLASFVAPELMEGSLDKLHEGRPESFREHMGWTVFDPPHRDSEGALLSYQVAFLPKTARSINLAVCRIKPRQFVDYSSGGICDHPIPGMR